MENVLLWFKLKSVPGIGNHLFKRLINRFGSPEHVFEASQQDLLEVDGMTPRLAAAIKGHRIPEMVQKDIDLLIQKGYDIITQADDDYPPLLLQIPDPPPFLYVYGSLDSSLGAIAVVGSRNATSYGISTTMRLCRDLAFLKFIIVSGMAKGIDTAAHQGALAGNGKTIAVLGSGLERVYPPDNLKLFHQIAENGAVISEFPLMTEPEAHNFPRRNRIISGISLGTVVVEATKKSGALITARLAAEQNREVFAVPGSIQSFKSMGTHTLIKAGAKLVEHAQDIIEELPAAVKAPFYKGHAVQKESPHRCPPLSSEESVVFKTIGPYPVHIDDLVRKLSIAPGKLASILTQLELKGIVCQAPGKLFSVADR
ncbi:MAG: DNA-processing protein DprA [Pseudomonadota bacterium]|uniref:DNA-protecting protein DprA n=1 Tax=Candidatus Desulfatibia profunda TaxID=2841695 RepID=A0A8J6NSJ7_9BACT|nr:DNA-protecting protein DprA [Candidatus Desulfatibia profunda]MBL7179354.1 DNA-protecting protein DprA [Desulfobacterales bacterium]MBU0699306.1 DNA-processing protein DprA [Pseudomonadota bacterium]